MAGRAEDGGRDPPSEDKGSKSEELQSVNEAMVSGDPRWFVYVQAGDVYIVHIDLGIATVTRNALLLGDRVHGRLLLGDSLLRRVINGDHPVHLNLYSRRLKGRSGDGSRKGDSGGGIGKDSEVIADKDNISSHIYSRTSQSLYRAKRCTEILVDCHDPSLRSRGTGNKVSETR